MHSTLYFLQRRLESLQPYWFGQVVECLQFKGLHCMLGIGGDKHYSRCMGQGAQILRQGQAVSASSSTIKIRRLMASPRWSQRHLNPNQKDAVFQTILKATLHIVQQAQALTHIVQGQAVAGQGVY